MKIIKMGYVGDTEVAYILDEENGRVIKVIVEDLTGFNYGRSEIEPIFEEPKLPRRTKPTKIRVPAQNDEPREITIDDIPDEMLDRRAPRGEKPNLTNVTRVKRPNIIPPNLAGVFRKPGEPGAATEVRNV